MEASWHCVVVVTLGTAWIGGCDPKEDAADSSGGTSGLETTSGSSTGSIEPPAFCETRQQTAQGTLARETDIQAICEAGEVVALHRPSSVACATPELAVEPCSDPGGECVVDEDCTGFSTNAACGSFDGTGGACSCVIPCSTDADCDADRACLCRSAVMLDKNAVALVEVGGCFPAACRTDADCGPEGQCAFTNPASTCVLRTDIRLSCRGPDGCQSDAGCPDRFDAVCYPPPDGGDMWTCGGPSTCQ